MRKWEERMRKRKKNEKTGRENGKKVKMIKWEEKMGEGKKIEIGNMGKRGRKSGKEEKDITSQWIRKTR